MIEILGGGELEPAFKFFNINATRTYKRTKCGDYEEQYEVWEMSESDFKTLCEVNDAGWDEDWGWWRHAEGSNMGPVYDIYLINGNPIKAWDGLGRSRFCDDCDDECSASDEERLECYGQREYTDLFRYSCDEIGASTERNFCAIMTDLAKQNDMKMSVLFQRYMG